MMNYIKYNDYNENREKDTAQNIEVFEYMTSSLNNERKVVDKIINKGVKSAQNFQYIINEENLKRFLTPSAMLPMARDAYKEVKLEEQQEKENISKNV